MLNLLIEAYQSRLTSYHFLVDKVERELDEAKDLKFIQFCDCESKRLRDLIQLNKQIIADLMTLRDTQEKNSRLLTYSPSKK
jgi:hypothetical protein